MERYDYEDFHRDVQGESFILISCRNLHHAINVQKVFSNLLCHAFVMKIFPWLQDSFFLKMKLPIFTNDEFIYIYSNPIENFVYLKKVTRGRFLFASSVVMTFTYSALFSFNCHICLFLNITDLLFTSRHNRFNLAVSIFLLSQLQGSVLSLRRSFSIFYIFPSSRFSNAVGVTPDDVHCSVIAPLVFFAVPPSKEGSIVLRFMSAMFWTLLNKRVSTKERDHDEDGTQSVAEEICVESMSIFYK